MIEMFGEVLFPHLHNGISGIQVHESSLAKPAGLLIGSLQQRLRIAQVEDVPGIVKDIQAWQTRLWKYNKIGHFGTIRPWHEVINPLSSTQEIRVKLDQPAIAGVICLDYPNSLSREPQEMVLPLPRGVRGVFTLLRIIKLPSRSSGIKFSEVPSSKSYNDLRLIALRCLAIVEYKAYFAC